MTKSKDILRAKKKGRYQSGTFIPREKQEAERLTKLGLVSAKPNIVQVKGGNKFVSGN